MIKDVNADSEKLTLRNLDWLTAGFLILTPIFSILLVPPYILSQNFQWKTLIFAIFMYFATTMAITAGYHRLFSHKGYKARTWVQLMYLLFGAASFQGSAAKWCTDHRRHHQKVDSHEDPYSIKRGLFFAHIGWLIQKESEQYRGQFAKDLIDNKWIYFQNRFYIPLAIFMGFGFPSLMGYFWGDAWGAFILAGILRTVLVHHGTFLINSLCHFWGSQPFTDKHSAKDNLLMAFLTNGEGYHNFHHTFATDYRNGWKWYHWDPTKWMVGLLAGLGQAYQLRRVPDQEILRLRRLREQQILEQKGLSAELLEQMIIKIEHAQIRIKELHASYSVLKKDIQNRSHQKYLLLKAELRVAKIERSKALAQWNTYVRAFAS